MLIHILSNLHVKMVYLSSVVLSKVKLRKLIPHTEREGFSTDEITHGLFWQLSLQFCELLLSFELE